LCDTVIILGNSSEDGSVIFGKNSDRDANEPHSICYIPRQIYKEGEKVKAQYVSVDQVDETYALILAKPAWLNIGCEMGANEFGVVIGNEAVFTKEKYEKIGLLGMDLATIALERSKTAREGLDIITKLIKTYRQGGVASLFDPNFFYHNSFIIADPKEAWILETADKFWVAKKVKDIGTISNGLTIQKDWDLASPNLIEHAIENKWCESKIDFNFADCYSDPDMRQITGCLDRQSRTVSYLSENKGKIDASMVMNILRDHGPKFEMKSFNPSKATMSQVCMHYSSKTVSQTTCSMVSKLSEVINVHWLTGTSSPCISVFKPFFFESPDVLKKLEIPAQKNDSKSLWWKHEKLHRLTLLDYPVRAPIIIEKNRKLEQELIKEVDSITNNIQQIEKNELNSKLNKISSDAFRKNISLINQLTERVSEMVIEKPAKKSYLKTWSKLNKEVELEI